MPAVAADATPRGIAGVAVSGRPIPSRCGWPWPGVGDGRPVADAGLFVPAVARGGGSRRGLGGATRRSRAPNRPDSHAPGGVPGLTARPPTA
jgi:hypothetical protein